MAGRVKTRAAGWYRLRGLQAVDAPVNDVAKVQHDGAQGGGHVLSCGAVAQQRIRRWLHSAAKHMRINRTRNRTLDMLTFFFGISQSGGDTKRCQGIVRTFGCSRNPVGRYCVRALPLP
jgi:hypothetical protein